MRSIAKSFLSIVVGCVVLTNSFHAQRNKVDLPRDGESESARATSPVSPEQVNTGVLQLADPTFNRPTTCSGLSGVGTAVHYDTLQFTPSQTGSIVISVDIADGGLVSPNGNDGAGPDTFMVLYGPGGFNPASPLTNCLAVNDDISGATNRRSRISTNIASAGVHTVVLTSFNNTPTTTNGDAALPWQYTVSTRSAAAPVLYGPTDFLVGDFGSGRIAIYDSALNFKGYLDGTAFADYAVDFYPNLNSVGVHRNNNTVKVYDPKGNVVSSFQNATNVSGSSNDFKWSPDNKFYIGNGSGPIFELDQAGTKLRGFGNVGSNYTGVVLIPGGRMWGNQFNANIEVFDRTTGSGDNIAPVSSFALDNGQNSAQAMTYSASTGTVLMTSNGGDVFERNSSTGAFIRKFLMSTVTGGTYTAFGGVTRGPSGNVYVTLFNLNDPPRIAVFNGTTGAFISSTNVSTSVTQPCNIVWLGNPATAAGVTVSGRVLNAEGRGVRNAIVTITNQQGVTRNIFTGAYGNYSFDDVEAGGTYVISVLSRRFQFAPRVIDVKDNLTDVDFTPSE